MGKIETKGAVDTGKVFKTVENSDKDYFASDKSKLILTKLSVEDALKECSVLEHLGKLDDIDAMIEDVKKAFEPVLELIDKIESGIVKILDVAKLMESIMRTMVDTIRQLFDMSGHTLAIDVTYGGLEGYIQRLNANLDDSSDPNRPWDEGSAVLLPILALVGVKGLGTAKESIEQCNAAYEKLIALWNNAENSRSELLKEITGASNWEEMKDKFWGHYNKKKLLGSHIAKLGEGEWKKKAIIADMFPTAVEEILNYLEGWMPELDEDTLLTQLKKTLNKIIRIVKKVRDSIVAWIELLTMGEIAFYVLPAISGTYDDKTGAITPAYKNLRKYLWDLPSIITKEAPEFGELTETDYYLAGYNIVLKGPSIKAVQQQSEALLAMFGIKE